MLVSLIRYLRGYLLIGIIGYSPERFLNLCSHHHINIWGLKPDGHQYKMYVSISGFHKLKPIIKKTKTRVVIIKRYGLPFFLHRYRKRKVFFAGAVSCILAIYLMSCCVWNIHIEGNYTRTDEEILKYLQTTHVNHGMKKSDIDCERIVKDLRKNFNDIIWVSASVEGTRLLIQVKENTDTIAEENVPESSAATDLIAPVDGEVVKIITRNGTPVVEPGAQVKKGDLLVCGRTEILNDSKEVVSYRYQSADADIYLKTTIKYEDRIPIVCDKKRYTGKERHSIFLIFGNHRFDVGWRHFPDSHYETFTFEERLRLGEHFYFPVFYGKRTVKEYRLERKNRTKEEQQQLLSRSFHTFCSDLEKKGVEIVGKDVKIYNENQSAIAKGSLTLIQKAEARKPTETIPIDEKNENPEGVY